MRIVGELKGGSLSRTVIINNGQRLLVRKYISSIENREYGLVRWQSQIRKLQLLQNFLGENVISIETVGLDNGFYYYDMPFYDRAINCSELFSDSEININIVNEITQLLDKMSQISFGEVSGSMSVYLNNEVLQPLRASLKQLESVQNGIFYDISGMKKQIESAIDFTLVLIERYKNKKNKENLSHGNLTLENILWDKDSKKLILIDPYSETYIESLCGDVSQISQSSLSGYEYIIKNNLYNDPSIYDYPYEKIPKKIKSFGHKTIQISSKFDWFDADLHWIMYASQFIRMFPFKIHISTKQAYFFLIHGIKLLKGENFA